MKLIVGNMSPKLREFIKTHQFDGKIIVINKMCNVKAIKNKVDLIIPFGKVEENGLITNTQVHLEELLMSVDVNVIFYGNKFAKNKIETIANKYNIEAHYVDFINLNRNIKI